MPDVMNDDRIDPRLRPLLASLGGAASTDAPDRDTLVAEANSPDALAMSAQINSMLDMFDTDEVSPETGLTISDHKVRSDPDGNTIRIRLVRPDGDRPVPCVYYIHGGGMQSMSYELGLYRAWGKVIAAQGVAVAMVDFRNCLVPSSVPEIAPFPAGLHDCVSGLKWTIAESAALGIDPAHVIVAGESGGGNLTLATGMSLLADGDIGLILGLYALCPYIAGSWPQERLPSSSENNGILLDLHSNRGAIAYGIEQLEARNPLAWPLFATESDVAGLPPTYIVVNECDPLRDEGVEFYRLLLRAGVAAQCRMVMGTSHGADLMTAICPDISRETAASIARFCREA
jgi:acetyl esterase/lipase